MSAAELLVGFLSVLAVSGTIALLGTLSFASKRLEALEDKERCPEILAWHKTPDKTRATSNVTRCTLRTLHLGPHHTKHPVNSEKDHWWNSPSPKPERAKKAKPESEEKREDDGGRAGEVS
jgi:hypothetical protein